MKYKMFLLLLVFCSFIANAQETEKKYASTIFKISPQHFASNSIKMGLEFFKNPTRSFSIYLGARTGNDDPYYSYSNELDGFFAEGQFRKYVKPFEEITTKKNRTFSQGIYVAAFFQGGGYQGDVTYTEPIYSSTGVYLGTTQYKYQQNVVNGAGGFTIGIHRVYWDVLYIDVYVGGGLQLSNLERSGDVPSPNTYNDYYYSSDFIDPNFQGVIPKIGIQIGLGL